MLERIKATMAQAGRSENGDTLIEVTLALAILGFVLLSSTVIGAAAYRMGQTARERTQVAAVAQEQMEALRSFRDNHTWNEFRAGTGACLSSTTFCGVDTVLTSNCTWSGGGGPCFYMKKQRIGTNTQWVPVPGAYMNAATDVPTQFMAIEVSNSTAPACRYDFTLHYEFTPVGGGTKAANRISTRLANLKFDPAGGAACPAS